MSKGVTSRPMGEASGDLDFAQDTGGGGDVAAVLWRHQSTLDELLLMQKELHRFMENQSIELDRRLSWLCRPRGDEAMLAEYEMEDAAATTTCDPTDIPTRDATEEGRSASKNAQRVTDSMVCEPGASPPRGVPGPAPGLVGCKKVNKHHKDALIRKRKLTHKSTLYMPTGFTWLKQILRSPLFDSFMGAIIVLNFLFICIELEWKSHYLAQLLGRQDHDGGWSDAEPVFKWCEWIFNVIYLMELLIQVSVFRLKILKHSCMHLIDMLGVLFSSIDSFILEPALKLDGSDTKALSLLRFIKVMRAMRLLRFMRVLRIMSSCHSLRVLVRTVSSSIGSLAWSMAVMAFFILSSALLIAQLTQGFIENAENDPDKRKFVFLYFGSAIRAAYSMFEATFSGAWATRMGRPLIDDVSIFFRFFFVIYTVCINFALTRIVGALFLKQTMDIAAIDAERMATAKTESRDRHLQMLMEIFDLGDVEGDGKLGKEEFEDMMENLEVLAILEELEIEPPEMYMLYNLLHEEGEGHLNKEEFFQGCLKLKNSVTPVDIVQLRHEFLVIRHTIENLKGGVDVLTKAHNQQQQQAWVPWRRLPKPKMPSLGLQPKSPEETFTAAL